MTRLVEQWGGVWRLSELSYTRLLHRISLGEPYELDAFGKYLGNLAVSLVDFTAEEAQDLLKGVKVR